MTRYCVAAAETLLAIAPALALESSPALIPLAQNEYFSPS